MTISIAKSLGAAAAIGLAALTTTPALAQVDSGLNTSSNVTQFSGPLSNVQAPTYDGPVMWGSQRSMGMVGWGVLTGGMGLLGAFLGGGLTDEFSSGGNKDRKIVAGMLVGAIALATPGVLIGQSQSEISVHKFQTTVQSVPDSQPPHKERHGKSTYGPYFSQVISIPESTLLFATNAQNAPFIPGQKITATVFVGADNKIISWVAAPGLRDQ